MDRTAQLEKLVLWLYRLSPGELRFRLATLRPRARRNLAGHWLRDELKRLAKIEKARRRLPTATDPLHVVLNTIASRIRDEFPQMNRGGCGLIARVLLEELVANDWDCPSMRYVFHEGTDVGPLHFLLRLSDGYLFDTDYGVHRWSDRVREEGRELRVYASPSRLFIFEIQAAEFVRRQIRLGFYGARSYSCAVEEMRDIVVGELSRSGCSLPE